MQLLNEKTHKTITMINKIKTQRSSNTNPAKTQVSRKGMQFLQHL